MALRVDDIVVTEKNVMLLHDGHQYVADIEKEKEITNTFNKSRDSNPWNLKTSDGYIINNLFELSSFDVRTQVVTGSNGISTNYKQSHEKYFMPNSDSYLGMCQFYDNAYSITDRTLSSFSSTYSTTAGTDIETYESDDSMVRYEMLSSYDNMVDYYISPNTAFMPVCGVQYLTEYPVNSFYSDFGDNENTESPTVYGDSCPLKYYLNDEYSVESTYIDNRESTFSLRTYYGIGNTGNSIYLVYRNDVNGSTSLSSNGGIYVPTVKYNTDEYIIKSGIGTIGYMTNVVTICNENDKVMYASDPYSDFFEYTSLASVNGFSFIKQPSDHSFILYFKHTEGNTEITFVPRNGLDKSKSVKTVIGNIIETSVVELESSVVIATQSDGILVADSRTYGEDSASTDISLRYSPFTNAYIGNPSSDSLSAIDSQCGFSSISLYWNEKDILAAVASETVNGVVNRTALLSTDFDSEDGTSYEIGRYFMRAAVPSYEMDVSTVNKYSTTTVVSSVPSSYESGGKTIITYYLTEVDTDTITASYEVSSFNTATNRVVNGYDIIFDYSPVEIDGEVELGSYAFIQFGGYGLTKCHVSDIFRNSDFIRTTATGPANINDNLLSNSICKGVHFDFISYNEDSRKRANDILDYIGVNDNSNRIYGRPALYATYVSDSTKWYNTFSTIPFSDSRGLITEPTFSGSTAQRSVEYDSLTSCRYMLDEYIGNSYGVNVRTIEASGINHDASIALVKWNQSNGIYSSSNDYTVSSASVGGLHLQYNAICTELLVKGTNRTLDDGTSSYTSTVYEYPHPCFGELVTAGTGIHIFDGELSGSMRNDDIFMLNGYLIVKNFAVKNMETNVNSVDDETIRNSGKTYSHDSGNFQSGGYVVTNFFLGGESNIPSLYDSKLVSSSKVKSKTSNLSETIYDYSYLWHVVPSKPIEFYPESKNGSNWYPFYSNTYVDFIKYHNGYYYIALSNSEEKKSDVIGYELIETDDLFSESNMVKLTAGRYVSGIRFYDDNVAVEYTDASDSNSKETLWFKQGKISSKTYPIEYCNTTSFETSGLSSVNRAGIELSEDLRKTEARALYDNVEVIHSLNRFSSVVSHKSNIFSIKITDLGLDESPYLTETQKKNLRTWFKNRITTLVDSVKPANTQLFDVFIN